MCSAPRRPSATLQSEDSNSSGKTPCLNISPTQSSLLSLAVLLPSISNNPRRCAPVVLFQASMEFLGNEDEDTDEDEAVPFVGGPQRPTVGAVALETLPMRYEHARKEEQTAAVALGGQLHTSSKFTFICEDYFALRLKGEFVSKFV